MQKTTRPILVLGLDGLDLEKAMDWTPDLLLEEHGELKLDGFDRISTYWIWPTMVAGEHPRERGFPERDEGDGRDGGNWDTGALQVASRLSAPIIPKAIRSRIGGSLSKRGFSRKDEVDRPGRDVLEGDCLFDPLKARVIDVPGWNFRESLDIEFSEVSLWEIALEDDGVERVYEILNEEIEEKTEATRTALGYSYDLVWVHIHALDSIQHLFDRDIQRNWYDRLANDVKELRKATNPRLTVVLSDHGLKGGDHREPGLVSVSDPELVPLPRRPREVRGWLEELVSDQAAANRERLENLEALGYRDIPTRGGGGLEK